MGIVGTKKKYHILGPYKPAGLWSIFIRSNRVSKLFNRSNHKSPDHHSEADNRRNSNFQNNFQTIATATTSRSTVRARLVPSWDTSAAAPFHPTSPSATNCGSSSGATRGARPAEASSPSTTCVSTETRFVLIRKL